VYDSEPFVSSPACRCVDESFCWPCTRRSLVYLLCITCDCLWNFVYIGLFHNESNLVWHHAFNTVSLQVCHRCSYLFLAVGKRLGTICLFDKRHQEPFWSQSPHWPTLAAAAFWGQAMHAGSGTQHSRECRWHLYRFKQLTLQTMCMSDVHIMSFSRASVLVYSDMSCLEATKLYSTMQGLLRLACAHAGLCKARFRSH